MMDEVWSRGWSEAHKAALQARETRACANALEGRPMPSLWGELRMLVRDLIAPPVRPQTEDAPCDPATCQQAACQSVA